MLNTVKRKIKDVVMAISFVLLCLLVASGCWVLIAVIANILLGGGSEF